MGTTLKNRRACSSETKLAKSVRSAAVGEEIRVPDGVADAAVLRHIEDRDALAVLDERDGHVVRAREQRRALDRRCVPRLAVESRVERRLVRHVQRDEADSIVCRIHERACGRDLRSVLQHVVRRERGRLRDVTIAPAERVAKQPPDPLGSRPVARPFGHALEARSRLGARAARHLVESRRERPCE